MKIATYNVNGINGRLAVLLRWLELAEPDVVCLQELKAPDERFPEAAIRDLGYEAIWLREDEPHPVRTLVAGTNLGQRCGKDTDLRFDETVKIMPLHRTSAPCAGGVP